MSLRYTDKQKSLKRRFLLILGVVTLLAVLTLGSMLIFWTDMRNKFGLSQLQAAVFGGLFIAYGFLRFSRLLKKDTDEA